MNTTASAVGLLDTHECVGRHPLPMTVLYRQLLGGQLDDVGRMRLHAPPGFQFNQYQGSVRNTVGPIQSGNQTQRSLDAEALFHVDKFSIAQGVWAACPFLTRAHSPLDESANHHQADGKRKEKQNVHRGPPVGIDAWQTLTSRRNSGRNSAAPAGHRSSARHTHGAHV